MLDSFKNRAMIYSLLLEELSAEWGEEKALEVMGRAIRRRGEQVGRKFAVFAPDDLTGLRDAFLGGIPDQGRLFEPEVLKQTDQELVIKFHRCPLKEAWLEAGMAQEEVAKLCEMAAQVDVGTFEGAGFGFHADTYQPGGDGCCRLNIRCVPSQERLP